MGHWLGIVGLVALGFAAEFAAEVWHIKYSNAVNERYARRPKEEMRNKVWMGRKWGMLLWALTQVDTGGAAYGSKVYLPIMAGAGLGAWFGIGQAMWSKWERLNGGTPTEDDDD